jgi:mRNA interferase RelE/StbE
VTRRRYRLVFHPRADREVSDLSPKQFKQVMVKALSLQRDPWPQDARPLRGFSDVWRVDQGEYRLACTVDQDETLVTVWAIGKRNDEEVYKLLKRRLG